MPDAAERMGIGKSSLSQYYHAKVCPPLGLEGSELEDWIILGHLAHAPERIEHGFLSMLKELEANRAELAGFREAMRELGIKAKRV